MNKLLVVNREAKEEQDADKVRVGKIGWLADFIENDGVGDHGYYLEEGKLIEKPETFSQTLSFNPEIVKNSYHEANTEERADFQARRK